MMTNWSTSPSNLVMFFFSIPLLKVICRTDTSSTILDIFRSLLLVVMNIHLLHHLLQLSDDSINDTQDLIPREIVIMLLACSGNSLVIGAALVPAASPEDGNLVRILPAF